MVQLSLLTQWDARSNRILTTWVVIIHSSTTSSPSQVAAPTKVPRVSATLHLRSRFRSRLATKASHLSSTRKDQKTTSAPWTSQSRQPGAKLSQTVARTKSLRGRQKNLYQGCSTGVLARSQDRSLPYLRRTQCSGMAWTMLKTHMVTFNRRWDSLRPWPTWWMTTTDFCRLEPFQAI